MRLLYDEIARRFPEVRDSFSDGDEELPYLVMGYVADWLKELPRKAVTPEIIERLVSFTRWCEDQPRGKTASDDLYTILVVAFYEKLFAKDSTRFLVPRFISREDFVTNADYLRTWVGADNYDETRKYYEPAA